MAETNLVQHVCQVVIPSGLRIPNDEQFSSVGYPESMPQICQSTIESVAPSNDSTYFEKSLICESKIALRNEVRPQQVLTAKTIIEAATQATGNCEGRNKYSPPRQSSRWLHKRRAMPRQSSRQGRDTRGNGQRRNTRSNEQDVKNCQDNHRGSESRRTCSHQLYNIEKPTKAPSSRSKAMSVIWV